MTHDDDTTVNWKTVPFRIRKTYLWKPKEDITTYELVLCLPIITNGNSWYDIEYFIEALPENARRHFEELKK